MNNNSNLDTHNEVITVSEPWHRGSGFTWMLLALAGAVFFLSGAVAKAQVTYTMQTGNFNSLLTERNNNPPYAGTYNNGATEIGNYANGGSFGNTPGAAAFQTFTTTGNGNSGAVRALQVGDTFTITGFTSANPSAGGYLGISFRDSTTYSNFFSSTDSATEARFQLDNTGGWKVYNAGTAVDSNLGSNADRTFTIKITSDNTFNATVGGTTYYDLSMAAGGGKIDSFSIYTFGDSNQNSFWKSASLANTGTVELGYAAPGGTTRTFSTVISDGLAANSTSTTSANAVFVGGNAGSQVNLTAANTYTGLTTVNQNARLEIQNASALGGTTSGTTVSDGGALTLYQATGGITVAGESLTLNGVGVSGANGALRNTGGNNAWNGAITLGANTRINADTTGSSGSLTIGGAVTGGSNVLFLGAMGGTNGNTGGNITINGAISGAGAAQNDTTTSIYKDGVGTLTLGAANTYTGDTRIAQGNLTISGSGNLGSGSDVFIAGGGSLTVNASSSVASVREWGTTNGGTITLGSAATLTVNGADKGTMFQNSISGSGNLTMAGSGTTSLGLYGSQTYTGDTTVSGGKISTGVALSTAKVTVSGGVFETSAADLLGNSASVNISGTGDYSLGGDDTVGALTISGGQLSGSSTLTAATYALQGGTVGANLGAGAATASTGTTALNGNLTGSLEATGGTVNAAGTIGGNVTVSGGTVNLSASDRIANGAAVSVSSGTLGMGANNDTVGSFSISGGTLGGTGKLTAATYGLSGGTVNANLGAGTVNANSGTTSLNGSVDATTVNVGGGTLNLGSSGRLAAGATANVTSGTLSTGGNETITRLNATGGTVNLTDDTLTVTGTGANKSSVGSAVTATGGTIYVQGTLDYQAASGTTALSIASGGTLTGSGTTTGTLSVGGTLALGNSPGTLNVGATTFLAGANYEWEINDFVGGTQGINWDFLNVTGALTVAATAGSEFYIDVIGLLPGSNEFVFTNNYSFAIATASGGITGFDVTDFIIRTNNFGSAMTASGYTSGSWSIGLANDDKDLVLTYSGAIANNISGASAIPEPSSAALTLIGLGVLALRRRCRR